MRCIVCPIWTSWWPSVPHSLAQGKAIPFATKGVREKDGVKDLQVGGASYGWVLGIVEKATVPALLVGDFGEVSSRTLVGIIELRLLRP